MGLNNTGDTVELINENGQVIQSFTYSQASEDEIIIVN